MELPLPPELREKILQEVIKQKIQDKKRMGWGEIYKKIKLRHPGPCKKYSCFLCDLIDKEQTDVEYSKNLIQTTDMILERRDKSKSIKIYIFKIGDEDTSTIKEIFDKIDKKPPHDLFEDPNKFMFISVKYQYQKKNLIVG